ncbi:MAG: hypothetical protein HY261_10320 [Chloroflexi bacterium]|nr:hypothetical protein [Chloroflexota bacterium]
MAAVVAAIDSYIEEEAAAIAQPAKPSRWVRSGRVQALKGHAAWSQRIRRSA